MKDELGDRLKQYEAVESDRRFMPGLPVLARLDGRAFHTFCRGLKRPFDEDFHRLMVKVAQYLLEETGALVAYTQSDEISLVWQAKGDKSQIFFDGRVVKMTSILAAMASVEFNRWLPSFLPEKVNASPLFDCRVWQVPNQEEAANTFLWRELDASKNSVSMLARAHFSHKSLQDLTSKQMQERLFKEAGTNWNDLPAWAKRGTWLQRQRVVRRYTADEIEQLPPKHAARANPELEVERWRTQQLDMPKFSSIANQVEVIFNGDPPVPR